MIEIFFCMCMYEYMSLSYNLPLLVLKTVLMYNVIVKLHRTESILGEFVHNLGVK